MGQEVQEAPPIEPLSLAIQTPPTTARAEPEPTTSASEVSRATFVEYFAQHFSGHEPIYFIGGWEVPNVKFQISFKYRLLNPEGSWTKALPFLGGMHVAYSQTSFWDLEGNSKPFFDSSYRPEFLFSYDNILSKNMHIPGVARLGLQTGLQHESNGKSGTDSRSLNIAYVRPVFVMGKDDGLFLTVAPRVFTYIGDLDDNPDIKDFRGHVDMRVVAGWAAGFQAALIGRIGDDWDKGSLQLDLTYPLRAGLHGNMDIYFLAQFFTGYGESLLHYNDADNSFRLGFAIVR